MKKIILLSLLIFAGVFSVCSLAFADGAVMSVSPVTASETVGSQFNVSVNVLPNGEKACVVKGTLSFDNLSCKTITVASGIMAQVAPTCTSPSFTLGIPKCATSTQNILTVLVAGKAAGQASLSVASAKIIGSGSDVVFTNVPGSYTITQLPQPKVEPVVPTQTIQSTELEEETTVAEEQPIVQENIASASLATGKSGFFNSPIFWIVIVIVLALIATWAAEKFYFKKKN